MNVTELARRLRVNTKELLQTLPDYGFDVGMKSIKIDDRVAQQVMRKWKYIRRDLEDKKRKELEEKKLKEKELRKEMGKTVNLPSLVTVRNFAERLELPVTQVLTELMKNGILANQNQNIDYDTAAIMAEELGFSVEKEDDSVEEVDRSEELEEALSKGKHLENRPPVVVVMGHVDHGKTRLLDTIRHANIIDTESGGITQHIGAYQTIWKDPKTKEEKAITFIDTPGHEAFTVMRSRGAKVADIAIMVVAADDGVKPQTEEVIQIIKAAKLPLVVAINKIDKEAADPMKVKTELAGRGIQTEEWGGDIPMVEISAKNNINIDKLLDILLLVSDINEENTKADKSLPAIGTIIESHVDKNTGPVATVLVQAGTLRKNDKIVVNGEIYGKVRAMRDYNGKNVDEALPSTPVQIIGFKVAPEVGDVMDLGKSGSAKKIDIKQKRTQMSGAQKQPIVDTGGSEDEEEKKKMLNLVVKSDVLGSLEAIIGSLEKINHEDVGIKIIGKGLGNINETDIQKAEATGGFLVGFNVNPSFSAEGTIRDKGLTFKRFEIIYDLIDWVKDELENLLDDEKIITEYGKMEIAAVFRTEKKSMIVGGLVQEGKIIPNALARIFRDGLNMGIGKIAKCQIGNSQVKSIVEGAEGGITFEGNIKIEVGDILEVYTEESKIRKLILDK
jgi:translation initiation factor IF-2